MEDEWTLGVWQLQQEQARLEYWIERGARVQSDAVSSESWYGVWKERAGRRQDWEVVIGDEWSKERASNSN
ncbi:hypothetical protein NPIL_473021 [Nephila pilipes]|uniref:Uncharacterized protein n=1 Tax=Nephila pilipes TaxID=299642 RepID=A0A8X6QU63_NEPPI|nr:hypothetical protein NPIL_473021 [Nephila pilipes]